MLASNAEQGQSQGKKKPTLLLQYGMVNSHVVPKGLLKGKVYIHCQIPGQKLKDALGSPWFQMSHIKQDEDIHKFI